MISKRNVCYHSSSSKLENYPNKRKNIICLSKQYQIVQSLYVKINNTKALTSITELPCDQNLTK